MTPTLKLAFIGCGGIAHAHLRGIRSHAPQIQVTAAVDPNKMSALRIAEQTGATIFRSLEAALASADFDAVDIMTPHDQHEADARLAFAAGKHVLLEKPISTSLESAERIFAAAREAGTIFMVAEQSQYWPDALLAQQLVRAGALGEIITASTTFDERLRPGERRTAWRFNKAITGGGICVDGGLHRVRPLRMALGEVDQAMAVLGHPLKEMQGESLAHALLRMESGVLATYHALVTDTPDGPGEDLRITGTEGILVVEKNRHGRTVLYDRAHPEGRSMLPEDATRHGSYGLELADFAGAVLQRTPLAAGPEESLADQRVVWAMYRSAETGRWEKVCE